MRMSLERFLKVLVALAIITASGTVIYYFGYIQPHEQAKNVQIQSDLQTQKDFEQNQKQQRYENCIRSAQSDYDDRWARTCHTQSERRQAQYNSCMALGLSKTNCEATAGKVDSSGNCALPNQTSANLDSDREKSLDRCLQELNAGLTLGYNYPASQNLPAASEPTLDTKTVATKSPPENKNAPKPQNSKPGLTPTAFAECLTQAAKTHNVPAAVLIGIMRVEGNHVGQTEGPVKDGSYRLGPMRISSLMVPELARKWNVSEEVAYKWVRDDGCVNVEVAAWILKNKINQYGTLVSGIAHYHSDDPAEGQAYSEKVVKTLKDFDLIKQQ